MSISVIYAEKAKRNPVAHGMQIITNILRLVGQHRPLFFFGLMSLVFLAIGSFMGVVTIDIYMNAHVLADGYALISVLMLMLGPVTLFVGLILHSVHSSFEEIKQTLARERAFERAELSHFFSATEIIPNMQASRFSLRIKQNTMSRPSADNRTTMQAPGAGYRAPASAQSGRRCTQNALAPDPASVGPITSGSTAGHPRLELPGGDHAG